MRIHDFLEYATHGTPFMVFTLNDKFVDDFIWNGSLSDVRIDNKPIMGITIGRHRIIIYIL